MDSSAPVIGAYLLNKIYKQMLREFWKKTKRQQLKVKWLLWNLRVQDRGSE